jgi:hypothetical protein
LTLQGIHHEMDMTPNSQTVSFGTILSRHQTGSLMLCKGSCLSLVNAPLLRLGMNKLYIICFRACKNRAMYVLVLRGNVVWSGLVCRIVGHSRGRLYGKGLGS